MLKGMCTHNNISPNTKITNATRVGNQIAEEDATVETIKIVTKLHNLPILRKTITRRLLIRIPIDRLSKPKTLIYEQTILVPFAVFMATIPTLAHIWSELDNYGQMTPIVKGRRLLSRHPTLHHLNNNLWYYKTLFQHKEW
jgi:hypothetical protein